eukprot:2531630-Amphidinium_carterae.2
MGSFSSSTLQETTLDLEYGEYGVASHDMDLRIREIKRWQEWSATQMTIGQAIERYRDEGSAKEITFVTA